MFTGLLLLFFFFFLVDLIDTFCAWMQNQKFSGQTRLENYFSSQKVNSKNMTKINIRKLYCYLRRA